MINDDDDDDDDDIYGIRHYWYKFQIKITFYLFFNSFIIERFVCI